MKAIEELRKEKGYTWLTFPKVIGVTREHYRKIEMGRISPSLGLAVKISDALDCTVNDLFGVHGYAIEGTHKYTNSRVMDKKLKIISDVTGVPIKSFFLARRKRELVQCRYLFFYYTRGDDSVSARGAIFEKDHATVLHGVKTIENLSFANKRIQSYMKEIEERLSV